MEFRAIKNKDVRFQCNRLLDAVVKNIYHKIISIYHAIYVNLFYNVTVSYLSVSVYDVLNTIYNDKLFQELKLILKRVFISRHKRVLSRNI